MSYERQDVTGQSLDKAARTAHNMREIFHDMVTPSLVVIPLSEQDHARAGQDSSLREGMVGLSASEPSVPKPPEDDF